MIPTLKCQDITWPNISHSATAVLPATFQVYTQRPNMLRWPSTSTTTFYILLMTMRSAGYETCSKVCHQKHLIIIIIIKALMK